MVIELTKSTREEIIIGATDWHNKCRILETWSAPSNFTSIDEGADFADEQLLELYYNELIKENP
ncbi:MAG: hypothetical protein GY710_26910 [Desulfobacteraceae bacterium]|nr:hypothetical protein [Desulfobacteraceae bacterium]